ncbi:MAG: alpha-L-rhamnosidase C-terminal domain-containing protein, partial [Spirochaetota bacterium]
APMDTPPKGIITHLNALLVKALGNVAYLSGVTGDEKTGKALLDESEGIRKAMNTYLWDEKRGAFIDSIHTDGKKSDIISLQTNVMAFLCGCIDGERKRLIEKHLLSPSSSFVQIGSPFMSFFYFQALAQIGKTNLIVDLIRSRWGEMLKYGATTCWETFPGTKRERLTRSHCHGWSATPVYFFSAHVLGVVPAKPGFEEIIVAPRPCGLKYAHGSVPTPKGTVTVEWEWKDAVFHIDVTAPPGCKINIIKPDQPD